jgi:hypothetical protein
MAAVLGTNRFRLTRVAEGRGVSCDIRGCYVGKEPLLTRSRDTSGRELWAARPQSELEEALSARYGHPVDLSAKVDGLAAIADALNRGDVFRAQLGTLALKLPHPPVPAIGDSSSPRIAALLDASNMLRREQKPTSPGTNNCRGGGSCSSSANDNGGSRYAADPRIQPAQEVLPFPGIWEMPWARPWIRPAPPTVPWDLYRPEPVRPDMPWFGPNYYQRKDGASPPSGKRNPYNSPKCKEERAAADKFCRDLERAGFGKDNLRGMGLTFEDCWHGQVSVECGGKPPPPPLPRLTA